MCVSGCVNDVCFFKRSFQWILLSVSAVFVQSKFNVHLHHTAAADDKMIFSLRNELNLVVGTSLQVRIFSLPAIRINFGRANFFHGSNRKLENKLEQKVYDLYKRPEFKYPVDFCPSQFGLLYDSVGMGDNMAIKHSTRDYKKRLIAILLFVSAKRLSSRSLLLV